MLKLPTKTHKSAKKACLLETTVQVVILLTFLLAFFYNKLALYSYCSSSYISFFISSSSDTTSLSSDGSIKQAITTPKKLTKLYKIIIFQKPSYDWIGDPRIGPKERPRPTDTSMYPMYFVRSSLKFQQTTPQQVTQNKMSPQPSKNLIARAIFL